MSINSEIERLIAEYGIENFEGAYRKALSSAQSEEICTIIANQGVHSFPDSIMRGEIYSFSQGNFNLHDPTDFHEEMENRLTRLSNFLSKKKWKQIYLIISGHAVINMSIKLLVYRLTRVETRDWVYNGEQGYFSFQINMRDVIIKSTAFDTAAD